MKFVKFTHFTLKVLFSLKSHFLRKIAFPAHFYPAVTDRGQNLQAAPALAQEILIPWGGKPAPPLQQ